MSTMPEDSFHRTLDAALAKGRVVSADQPTPGVETVLGEHFIMWRDLEGEGPRGEWFCACDQKFGFSNTAIKHVAAALEPLIPEREAKAWGEGWDAGRRLESKGYSRPNPYRAADHREARP